MRQVAEKPVVYVEPKAPSQQTEEGWNDMPPPPDNFPDDWDSEWQPSFENAEIAARPEPKVNLQTVINEPPLQQTAPIDIEIKHDERGQIEAARETVVVQQIEPSLEMESTDFLPSLYIPLAQEEERIIPRSRSQ